MTKIAKSLIAVAAAGLLASAASATPVLWTLTGVTFSDGSIATGSFVFDSDMGTFSDVAITTGLASYDTADLTPIPFGDDATGLELVEGFVPGANADKNLVNFDFSAGLTSAGGAVPMVLGFPSFEGRCIAADCSSGFIDRVVTAGAVIGTAIPNPDTFALAGLGLLLAGIGARRRA